MVRALAGCGVCGRSRRRRGRASVRCREGGEFGFGFDDGFEGEWEFELILRA